MSTPIQSIDQLAGLVLAAGGSKRLGQPKQLLQLDGKPLICKAIETGVEFCGAGLVVVTGAATAEVEAAISGYPVRSVRNRNWQQGMAGSIKIGIGALAEFDFDALLIMLCDQPRIGQSDIARLVGIWQNSPSRIAAAAYRDTIGVPAIFPAHYVDELVSLQGDAGARSILKARSDISPVEMPAAGIDIDTPADLRELQ